MGGVRGPARPGPNRPRLPRRLLGRERERNRRDRQPELEPELAQPLAGALAVSPALEWWRPWRAARFQIMPTGGDQFAAHSPRRFSVVSPEFEIIAGGRTVDAAMARFRDLVQEIEEVGRDAHL